MANAERAIEKLYEDAAVRDSLADTEAQMLLRWGEDQIMRLADEAGDDAAFEAYVDQLRGLLKDANRFVGERGQLNAETRRARLDALMAEGAALGAPPAAEASALADSFAAGDDATTLQALLGLLTPAQASASAAADAAEPSETAPPPAAPEPAITDAHVSAAPRDGSPEPRSVLQAFRKWLTPTKTSAAEPPAPDSASSGSPDRPPLTSSTPDDDTTGESFLHGETQDDRLD